MDQLKKKEIKKNPQASKKHAKKMQKCPSLSMKRKWNLFKNKEKKKVFLKNKNQKAQSGKSKNQVIKSEKCSKSKS